MTLILQLWLVIAALMVTSLAGSLFVTQRSARSYLEEQLTLKNIDNANAIAVTLSSVPDDPVTRELLLAAQFDTGAYQYLELRTDGESFALGDPQPPPVAGVPGWLPRHFPIQPEPGVAHVTHGWQQGGTLTVQSHSRFAYRELWRGSQQLLGYFAGVAALACALGALLLRWITRPLAAAVAQATAIGERRFTTTPEPRTPELRALVSALNRLSRRVQEMLTGESQRLGRRYGESLRDPLTGLLERTAFLERLGALLKRDDASSTGSFVILRLGQLSLFNRRYGRPVVDSLLAELAHALERQTGALEGTLLGRLNGSELAVAAPEHSGSRELAAELQELLRSTALECGVSSPEITAGAALYTCHDGLTQLLQRTDAALAIAEQSGGLEVSTGPADPQRSTQDELAHWTEELTAAFSASRFALETYPVYGRGEELLHVEAHSRLLTSDGSRLPAALFMPWVGRLGRMVELDLWVVRSALGRLAEHPEPLAINLSLRILKEPGALRQLVELIRRAPDAASRLWLEVPERGVYGRLEGLRSLCLALHPLGCRLGIEHAGPQVSQMGALYDLGLDYLKLDSGLVRAIDARPGNRAFVTGLCTIAHSIGLQAIAEGVERAEEWHALVELGIDGGTGPFFPPAARAS